MKTTVLAAASALFLQPGVTSKATAAPAERLAPGVVSTAKTEINFQLADSEELGVFTRAEADYSLGKIFLVDLDEGRIANTETIGFSDPRYKDSDPWLSSSGDELYFISNRPAFLGDVREHEDDYDIWRSRRAGEHWTAPEHLASVNSLAGEFGPEINRGYLYFSSKKRGGYEIYRAPMLGDGFGQPELLPEPFNGPDLNSDFTLTKDGRVALWWSTRPGGEGSGDLYVSRLTEEGWTTATNLGPEVNSPHLDFTPSLSPNNAILYFASNRPVPGQDAGASDVYAIPVKDLKPLREALSASTQERLKTAFGGDTVLAGIDSFSYRLEIDRGAAGSNAEKVLINFRSRTIAVRDVEEKEYRLARMSEGDSPPGDGEVTDDELRQDLLATLSANFLFYLTAEDLALAGPEDVPGHGDLSWYRLEARGEVSPLLGIDPVTGRIAKVLTESGAIVMELDYLKDDNDLIWPHRFVVHRDGKVVVSGRFSELRINGPASDALPRWFQ